MELVTFYIGKGDNAKGFVVHKEFACHYSPVFKAAFNSQFIEGQTQTYRLEDTTPEVFQLLVQWLYCQTFDLITEDEEDQSEFGNDTGSESSGDSVDEGDLSDFEKTSMKLCQLWVLADRLQLPRLQNLAIDQLHRESRREYSVSTEPLHYIYNNTAVGSPLRQIFIHKCALDMAPRGWRMKYSKSYPQEFLFGVLACMSEQLGDQNAFTENHSMKEYHVIERED